MKQLETHPVFNPAIKVSDAPQKEKKTPPAKEDKEDLGFKLFEQAEKDPPPEKGSSKHHQSQSFIELSNTTTTGSFKLQFFDSCLYSSLQL